MRLPKRNKENMRPIRMRESGGKRGGASVGRPMKWKGFFFLIRNRRSTELIPKKIKQNHRQPQQQRQQQQDDKSQNGRRRGRKKTSGQQSRTKTMKLGKLHLL